MLYTIILTLILCLANTCWGIPSQKEVGKVLWKGYTGHVLPQSTLLSLKHQVIIPSIGLHYGPDKEVLNNLNILLASPNYINHPIQSPTHLFGDIIHPTTLGKQYGFIDAQSGLGIINPDQTLSYYQSFNKIFVSPIQTFDANGDGQLDLLMIDKSGHISVKDAQTLAPIWDVVIEHTPFHQFQPEIRLEAPAAIIDLTQNGQRDIVIGTTDGQLLALNGKNGTLLWKKDLSSAPFHLQPTIFDRKIYITNTKGKLFELGFSGKKYQEKSIAANQTLFQAPIVIDNTIIFITNTNNERQLWTQELDDTHPKKHTYKDILGIQVYQDPTSQTWWPIIVQSSGKLHILSMAFEHLQTLSFNDTFAALPVFANLDRNATTEIIYVTQKGDTIVQETQFKLNPIWTGPFGNAYATGQINDPLSLYPKTTPRLLSAKKDTHTMRRESEHRIYKLDLIDSPEYLITPSSIGHAKLGMPLGQFENRIPTPYSIIGPIIRDGFQWIQIFVEASLHYELRFPLQSPIHATTPIRCIQTHHYRYRTHKGVGPDQLVEYAEQKHGKPSFLFLKNYNTEWIQFKDLGPAIRFIPASIPSGIYSTKTKIQKTQQYTPYAKIRSIQVTGYR